MISLSDEDMMEERFNSSQVQYRGEPVPQFNRLYLWAAIIAGALTVVGAALFWERANPTAAQAIFDNLVEVDSEQSRIDTALPIPKGDLTVSQSFVAGHDGLQEIEVTLARYGEEADAGDGRLTLRLFDENGDVLVEETLSTATVIHNQEFRLPVSRQNDSAGQPYTLQISGNEENLVSVWGYSLDVYPDGQIIISGADNEPDTQATAAQDLRFLTRYQLTVRGALQGLGAALYAEGLFIVLALMMLPMPGCLLLLLFHYRWVGTLKKEENRGSDAWPWDPAVWWAAALALGIATWPLIWMWLTLAGGAWAPWSLSLVLIAGWLAVLLLWLRDRNERRNRVHKAQDIQSLAPHPPLTMSWRPVHLVLLAILLAGFAVRILAVRDVSFPPWVDSSRHALITAVMSSSGQTIADYEPYLPVDRFPYHFGFHTLAANLSIVSNWSLPRLLLNFGQLLNALVPLALYAAVWLFIRRRAPALLAAFLVAIPFFFPAYYATWGRFTQLTAVFLLPILLALTWRLIRDNGGWQRMWWFVALLAAGLFLTHFRVFLYYLPFPLLVWIFSRGRNTRWLAAAVAFGVLLSAPRLVQLVMDSNPIQRIGQTIPNYNNFPTNYVQTGWEQAFIAAALAGVVLLIVALFRRRTWATAPLLLLLWVGILFLLLSADRVGLPLTSLVNLNSMYIILFVPLAIFLALLFAPLWNWLVEQHWLLQTVGALILGALVGGMLLFGVRQQITILNAQTILAKEEDLIALQWLDANLPADTTLAVNSWQWLGETWAAADGGAWIVPLTGRAATTPPIDHIYNPDLFRFVREFNLDAATQSDWSDPAQAQWLKEQGITHIFVGKKGGYFDPAVLSRNPQLDMVFGQNGVFIFAVGG